MSASELNPAADLLPRPVLTKVLVLVAEVLPEVTPVPAPLRKVASFAPNRRARLGASAMIGALAEDDFRRRVATQARARNPGPMEALEKLRADEGVPGEDLVELAAHCWLHRPSEWQTTLARLLEQLDLDRETSPSDGPELAALRERLVSVEQSVRDLKAEHRIKLAEVKGENVELRRKLGEARSALRQSRSEAEEAALARARALADTERATRQLEAESRRLRAQVDRLSLELQSIRREGRSERDEATVRTRLLLDTIVEAASGLRRELALRPVEGVPADTVVVAADSELGAGPTTFSSAPDSPELLERLLALPRARLLIDGYNVTKTGWPTSSLEAQRIRLLSSLASVVARTGAETTVVFDAHAAEVRPVLGTPRGVRVVFSPKGVIADDVLRQFVAAEPRGRVVVVVTSDQELGRDLGKAGAKVVASSALVDLLTR